MSQPTGDHQPQQEGQPTEGDRREEEEEAEGSEVEEEEEWSQSAAPTPTPQAAADPVIPNSLVHPGPQDQGKKHDIYVYRE